VTATLLVPVFLRMTRQLPFVALKFDLQLVTWAVTCAELVNDPKRPNTNPAIAIAAMRVIAMRITVARTGEIAFLSLGLLILKICYLSYDQTPENGTEAPLLSANEPVAVEPAVWAVPGGVNLHVPVQVPLAWTVRVAPAATWEGAPIVEVPER